MYRHRQLEVVEKEDRSVSFPAVYEKVGNLSALYKRRYYAFTKFMVLLLVVVPALLFFTAYFFTIGYNNLGKGLGVASVIMLASSLISEIVVSNYNFARKWQICRSVAESIKRETWFYWIGNDSYPTIDHNRAMQNLIKAEKELIRKLTENNILIEVSDSNEFALEVGKGQRELDVSKKWNFYRSKRQQEQIDWYVKQAKLNRRLRRRYFVFSFILMIISIASSIFFIFVLKQYVEVTDVVIAFTLATKTFTTAKQFDYLEFTYTNTSVELMALRDSTNDVDVITESDLLNLVERVENTISREHEVWVIKTLVR